MTIPGKYFSQDAVHQSFRELTKLLRGFSRNERIGIRKAFEFANSAHEGVTRKSGEPYILHPLAVARIVAGEMGLHDSTAIICALIHDVVEDTNYELHDIKREFGNVVMEITDGLTKISGSEAKSDLVSDQAENFRKILLTISDDVRVVLIKLADRLHNMRTLGAMRKEKVLKIASETLYIYAPLAHRLGLYQIKTELEDLSFKHSEPDKYRELSFRLDAVMEEADKYIRSFIRGLDEAINPMGIKYAIKYRFKSIYSIYQKMLRKKLPFEEVYDLFAIRVILETREGRELNDCWQVYSVLSGMYTHNPKRLRDWISMPKENGYESLHTTVLGPSERWVEVQIRTERMDEIAEKGIAAHWRYKESDAEEAFFGEWIEQIREVLENPSLDALEALHEFKEKLQPNDVYVFTPKGEVHRFPMQATALDFAYRIHTGLGDSSIGAKINQKVENLEYQLRPGDTIEILTSSNSQPSRDWLRFVKTSRAKESIKQALKRQKREIINNGERMFNWKAAKYGLDQASPIIQELLAYLMVPNMDELYYSIGAHRINTQKIADFIQLKKEGKEVEEVIFKEWELKKRMVEERFEEIGVNPETLVLGKEQSISKPVLANCCRPLHGEEILGFADGDKIIIHRPGCPKAISLMASFGSRIVKAQWAEEGKDVEFLAAIRIVGHDKKGMLNEMIKIISLQMKRNIRKVTIESVDGLFEGIFKVFVRNVDELDEMMGKLEKLPNVHRASRFDLDEDFEEKQ
ncbi:MAG: RelA/SpoT family protein [Bacteroidia bacterium]|nr:RelA/SpoT family protein [Bacteroidia bacterium]